MKAVVIIKKINKILHSNKFKDRNEELSKEGSSRV